MAHKVPARVRFDLGVDTSRVNRSVDGNILAVAINEKEQLYN